MTTPPYRAARYNQIVEVEFRAGWIGLLSGENQTKALNRTLDQLNAQGHGVAGMVIDRWSIWRRLLWLLVFILTLGFVGRVPNVLIATEPINAGGPPPTQPAPPPPAAAIESAAPATQPSARPAKATPRRAVAAKDAPATKKAPPRKRTTT